MNRVEEQSFYHSLEEEAINVDCLLVEPRSDQVSVNSVWCYEEDKLGKCIKTGNASYNLGVPDSNTNMKGVDTTILNALDVLPREVGAGNLLTRNPFPCDDYLLGYVSNEGLHIKNSQFPMEGSFGIQNSLIENISGIECHNYLLSNCIFGTSTYSSEPKRLDRFDDFSNSFIDQENNQDIMPPHLSQNGSDSPPFCQDGLATTRSVQDHGVVGAITHKRSRKPTKRYIDESSILSLKNSKKRKEVSSGSKVKISGVRRVKSQTEVKPKEKPPSAEISFDKAIQVPFISHAPTECQKSYSPAKIKNCVENHSSGSEDDSKTMIKAVTSGNQRKLHRVWTVSEVKKLLDGVSRYGVGKWTHIKKLLFTSSVHRTPVDLKDKWRNLLKASHALKGSLIEDNHKRNQSWRPLPKSILRHVRELASVYAYPKETPSKICKSKLQVASHISSPARIKSNKVLV